MLLIQVLVGDNVSEGMRCVGGRGNITNDVQ